MTIPVDPNARQLRAPLNTIAYAALAWAAYVAVRDQSVNRYDFLKLARFYFDSISNAAEVGEGENALKVLSRNKDRHD